VVRGVLEQDVTAHDGIGACSETTRLTLLLLSVDIVYVFLQEYLGVVGFVASRVGAGNGLSGAVLPTDVKIQNPKLLTTVRAHFLGTFLVLLLRVFATLGHVESQLFHGEEIDRALSTLHLYLTLVYLFKMVLVFLPGFCHKIVALSAHAVVVLAELL